MNEMNVIKLQTKDWKDTEEWQLGTARHQEICTNTNTLTLGEIFM
jgi:hypothetical protein